MLSSVPVIIVLVVCGHCLGVGPDDLPPRFPLQLPARACYTNNDCNQDKACLDHKCQDPCPNACGSNAYCRVVKHSPVCKCNDGFIGDPTDGCTIQACKPQNIAEMTGKKRFDFSTFKLNWYGAFMNCQSRGMRMATIDSKEQDDDFITLMREGSDKYNYSIGQSGPIWVGATDLVKEGEWFWMTTGQPIFRYKHWSGAEPNNAFGDENCMAYWETNKELGWCDLGCGHECYFACEYY